MLKCTGKKEEWYSLVSRASKGRYTACPGYAGRCGRVPKGQREGTESQGTNTAYLTACGGPALLKRSCGCHREKAAEKEKSWVRRGERVFRGKQQSCG